MDTPVTPHSSKCTVLLPVVALVCLALGYLGATLFTKAPAAPVVAPPTSTATESFSADTKETSEILVEEDFDGVVLFRLKHTTDDLEAIAVALDVQSDVYDLYWKTADGVTQASEQLLYRGGELRIIEPNVFYMEGGMGSGGIGGWGMYSRGTVINLEAQMVESNIFENTFSAGVPNMESLTEEEIVAATCYNESSVYSYHPGENSLHVSLTCLDDGTRSLTVYKETFTAEKEPGYTKRTDLSSEIILDPQVVTDKGLEDLLDVPQTAFSYASVNDHVEGDPVQLDFELNKLRYRYDFSEQTLTTL